LDLLDGDEGEDRADRVRRAGRDGRPKLAGVAVARRRHRDRDAGPLGLGCDSRRGRFLTTEYLSIGAKARSNVAMMRTNLRRPSPSLVISMIALFVAMSGTVYAAKSAKISGKAIKVKSLPGNRLKPGSVPANRLAPGVLSSISSPAAGAPGVVTGLEIDELSLGQVPEAAHAQTADFARSATDAEVALNAVNAVNASKVNGYEAGCVPNTELFASACWQTTPAAVAVPPVAAAQSCAAQGGVLPEALQLVAFSQEPGVTLASPNEWSSDIPAITPPEFAVITVSPTGVLDFAPRTDSRKYRCVFPLLR
jgi:hypothetical protein